MNGWTGVFWRFASFPCATYGATAWGWGRDGNLRTKKREGYTLPFLEKASASLYYNQQTVLPRRSLGLPNQEVRANETVSKPQRDCAPVGAGIQLSNSIAILKSRVKGFLDKVVQRNRENHPLKQGVSDDSRYSSHTFRQNRRNLPGTSLDESGRVFTGHSK